MDFSTQIIALRKREGLTQEGLAKRLSVSRQAVSNWENKRNLPDIETLIQIAQEFHVSLDALILQGDDKIQMTEKLIEDGSESKRIKMNKKVIGIGALLMTLGVVLLLVKANSVEYMDEMGVFHEDFYLLPLGFGSFFAGFVTVVSNGMWTILRKLWTK